MRTRLRMRESLIPLLVLLSFWALLIPELTIQGMSAGVAISAWTLYISRDLLFSADEAPIYILSNVALYARFVFTLLIDIVRSNIKMAGIILNPKLPIEPRFVRVPLSIKSDLNRTLQANAITLTPGTLSVIIDDDGSVLVHALTADAAHGLDESRQIRLLERTERTKLQ